MPPIRVKIDEQLFPIAGMSTQPGQPESEVHLEGNVLPTLAILVGKGDDGLAIAEVTAGGELKTASSGSGLDTYEVFNGTAGDANVALGVAAQSSQVTLEVLTYELTFSFQKSDDSWGADIDLTLGWHSWDFSFQDIRIKNETSGENAVYQITVMR